MNRPKRPVTKPLRFLSSPDEAPRKRAANGREKSRMQDDLKELRAVITENCSQVYDNTVQLYTQSQQMHTENQEIQSQSQEIQAQNEEIHTHSQEIHTHNDEICALNQHVPYTQNQQIHTQNQQIHTQTQQMLTQNEDLHTLKQHVPTQIQQIHTQNEQIHTQNQQMHTQNGDLYTLKQHVPTQNQQIHTQTQQIHTQNQQMHTQNGDLYTLKQHVPTQNQQIHTQISQLYPQSSETPYVQTSTNYPQQISDKMETSHKSHPIHYNQSKSTPTYRLNVNGKNFDQPHSSHAENNGQYSSKTTDERIDGVEIQLRKLNHNMEQVLKYLKDRDRHQVQQKVSCLPFFTTKDVQDFENVDDTIYHKVVSYLQYIGGFTAKEAVNLCFKEVMENEATTAFTWFGREENSVPLYNTRIVKAIYDAVSDNKHFDKPTRAEFQRNIREALRAAKQRERTHRRNKENRNRNNRQNAQQLWADEDNSIDNESEETEHNEND